MSVTSNFIPHQGQQKIIDSIIDPSNSHIKYYICNISRQWGKGLMAMNLLLYWALNDPGCIIIWIAPVYNQVQKVQREIIDAIEKTGIIKSNNFSDNILTLKNGTLIYFRSGERPDNIRGLTCDYGIIDEAAYLKEEAFTKAIKPIFIVKGKKVVFTSTPKGKNFFYNLYLLGLSKDYPSYISFQAPSSENPYISNEEIEDARKTLPKAIFNQEYKAMFIEGGGEVFSNINLNYLNLYPKPIGKVYCGVDLAKQEDYTVATFMDSKGNVIFIYRANQKEWTLMVAEMLVLIKKYNATVMIEVNSIGDVIFEMIKKKWNDTHSFITTNNTKQEIIEGLILDLNELNVMIPSNELFPVLTKELEVFTYDYNPKTRSIRYTHPPGMHDDTVISLAITNYLRKTKKNYGNYAIR